MTTDTTPHQAAVTIGSPALDALIAAIAQDAAARAPQDADPFAAFELVRRARLGALRVPREEGGGGSSLRELFAVVIALAEADPDLAHILRNHFSFVEDLLVSDDRAVRDRWLREVVAGRLIGIATTELGARPLGDEAPYATTVTRERDGDGWVLDGSKYFSTGVLFSDAVAVLATREREQHVFAVVPVDRAGVTLVDDWDGMGQRRTGSGTTRLERVAVAEHELIPLRVLGEPARPSYEGAMAQLWLQALTAGILRSVVRDAVGLIRGRARTFSHAAAEAPAADPLLQLVVGQLSSTAFATEAVVLAAADALDRAHDSARDGAPDAALAHAASLASARAKVHVDEVAARAAGLLFDVGGASAAKRSANLDRHWRNIRTLASHNPALYKAQAIGDHVVNGALLPSNGYF